MNLFCCCILPTLKAEHYIAPNFINTEGTYRPAHDQVSSEPKD